MTTPTPAATRAAQKALSARAKTKHSNGHLILLEIAAIIDSETGLPELIAACEAAIESLDNAPATAYIRGLEVNALRAALAKAT